MKQVDRYLLFGCCLYVSALFISDGIRETLISVLAGIGGSFITTAVIMKNIKKKRNKKGEK